MALGGGVFTTTNKVLPGSYINVVSKARSASLLGERGKVAIALPLAWGAGNSITKLTANEFYTDSMAKLGYPLNSDEETMIVLREIFCNASEVLIYNLNPNTTAAKNTEGTVNAVFGGTLGNSITVSVSTNVADAAKVDVVTKVGTTIVDSQTVASTGVPADNDWVKFSNTFNMPDSGTVISLSGGASGSAVDAETALAAFAYEDFNILCAYTGTDQGDYISFTIAQRNEVGKKFQCVVYNVPTANHEGIISVQNTTSHSSSHILTAWVAGAEAACPINKAITNKIYNGELEIQTTLTQKQLEDALTNGKFVFHRVASDVRVLEDINTYVGNTVEKNSEFRYNQTVRVIDQIANDISYLFNTKYIGNIANNAAGRVSLWNDIVKHHKELETIEAIENFDPAEIVVTPHATDKRAVIVQDAVVVMNCMTKMYMTLIIS